MHHTTFPLMRFSVRSTNIFSLQMAAVVLRKFDGLRFDCGRYGSFAVYAVHLLFPAVVNCDLNNCGTTVESSYAESVTRRLLETDVELSTTQMRVSNITNFSAAAIFSFPSSSIDIFNRLQHTRSTAIISQSITFLFHGGFSPHILQCNQHFTPQLHGEGATEGVRRLNR